MVGIPSAHRCIPCPADPAPVLEAARSLEDRLQQLQRLEPEPSHLKDFNRPWKKHPELISTKGTPYHGCSFRGGWQQSQMGSLMCL